MKEEDYDDGYNHNNNYYDKYDKGKRRDKYYKYEGNNGKKE